MGRLINWKEVAHPRRAHRVGRTGRLSPAVCAPAPGAGARRRGPSVRFAPGPVARGGGCRGGRRPTGRPTGPRRCPGCQRPGSLVWVIQRGFFCVVFPERRCIFFLTLPLFLSFWAFRNFFSPRDPFLMCWEYMFHFLALILTLVTKAFLACQFYCWLPPPLRSKLCQSRISLQITTISYPGAETAPDEAPTYYELGRFFNVAPPSLVGDVYYTSI